MATMTLSSSSIESHCGLNLAPFLDTIVVGVSGRGEMERGETKRGDRGPRRGVRWRGSTKGGGMASGGQEDRSSKKERGKLVYNGISLSVSTIGPKLSITLGGMARVPTNGRAAFYYLLLEKLYQLST